MRKLNKQIFACKYTHVFIYIVYMYCRYNSEHPSQRFPRPLLLQALTSIEMLKSANTGKMCCKLVDGSCFKRRFQLKLFTQDAKAWEVTGAYDTFLCLNTFYVYDSNYYVRCRLDNPSPSGIDYTIIIAPSYWSFVFIKRSRGNMSV